MTATLVETTGDCGNCARGEMTLTASNDNEWSVFFMSAGCPGDLHIRCVNGLWSARSQSLGIVSGGNFTPYSTEPFDALVVLVVNPLHPNRPCSGTLTYRVTE